MRAYSLLISGIISLLRIIPFKILSALVYWILLMSGYRKQVIKNNLIKAYRDSLDDSKIDGLYRKNVRFLSRTIIESLTHTKKKLVNRISYFNVKQLDELAIAHGGVLLLSTHYGNWEITCSLLSKYTNTPIFGAYKPIKSKAIDDLIYRLRTQYGLNTIPMKQVARVMINNQKNNIPGIYLLIADQNPNSIRSTIWADFFDIQTAYNNGPKKLHEKYGYPHAYMEVTPLPKPFSYNVTFDYDISPEDPIQEYSQRLEKQIREKPEFWLWSHKRWKRKHPSDQ